MKKLLILGLVATVWLGPCSQTAAAENLAIRDGDTFLRGSVVIRLAGIDAPELKQHCRDKARNDYPCGEASKAHLIMLLSQSPLRCRYNGHDKYNRTLAYCKAGDVNVNAEMVRRGYAIAYYTNDFVEQEAEAREAKNGLWAGSFRVPQDWRKLHPKGE